MTLSLAWKEYRTQRTIWLLLLVFALAALYSLIVALRAWANLDSGVGWLAAVTALAFPMTYGLVCGSLMCAGEREDRTLWFLDYHTGGRLSVWLNKLSAGIVFTASYSLIIGAVTMILGLTPGQDSPTLWLWLIPLVGVEAFLWGLLGSAFSRSGIMAIVNGASLLTLPWLLTLPQGWFPRPGVVLTRSILALGAAAASGMIFCRNDWQRSATWENPLLTRVFQPRWWALPWLVARQGAKAILLLAGASLVVGLWVPVYRIVLWPAATLVIGIVCGTAVFSGENAGGARFLGDRRIPAGRIWLVKTLIWFVLALALAAAIVVACWFRICWEHLQRSPNTYFSGMDPWVWREVLGLNDHLVGRSYSDDSSRQWWVFELAWLLTSFAVGQFCSITFRKKAIAGLVSMLSSIAVCALWVPSLVDRGLSMGWVLGFTGFLLAGSFLVIRPWTAGTLFMKKPIGVFAGSAVLAGACVAGHLAYRAFELPDIGEPFRVDEFETVLNSPLPLARGNALRVAADELVEHEKEVTRRLGVPAPLRLKDSGTELPAHYRSQLSGVLKNGWPKQAMELDRWLQETLQGRWVMEFQNAANCNWSRGPLRMYASSEPGILQSTYQLSLYHPEGPTTAIQRVMQLFEARAMLERDRGAHGAVLDDCETVLGVSRHLQHYGNSVQTRLSLGTQQFAFALLEKWLATLGPQTGLLQRAGKALANHERTLDPLANTVKVDYVMARNTFHSWEIPRGWGSYQDRLKNNLVATSRMAPWEKEYIRRLLNIIFEREIAWIDRPYWKPPPAPKPFAPLVDRSPEARYRELLPGFYAARFDFQPLFAEATDTLCRLRGLRLQVALALYQLQEKKPAARLADLLPRYLSELPVDPYSGRLFGYRISRGEKVRTIASSQPVRLSAGQALVWSTGPDGIDDGGKDVDTGLSVVNANGFRAARGDQIFLVPLRPER